MLNIVIIEDDEKTLINITTVIKEYCENVKIKGTADSVESALVLLTKTQVDLVLADINLPDGTSFNIFERMDEVEFKIVFITAFEEYAIKAIKFSALDYLMKPIDPKELITTIRKAQKHLESENENLKLRALLSNVNDFSKHLNKIVLKTLDSIYVVNIQNVVCCESDGPYTRFSLADSRKILVSKVLKEYDSLLKGLGFFRVHKSYLINLNHIDRFIKTDGGFLEMKDGSKIPVSLRKREKLLAILENNN